MFKYSSFGSVEVGYTGYLARHELALLYHRKGMMAEAEAEWRAVVLEQPEHLAAWLGLGELYLAQAKWPELDQVVGSLTVGCVKSARTHPPGLEERCVRADLTHLTNLEITPHHAESQALRARGMLARKEYEPAKSILREVGARNPAWVYPRIILSHVLLQEGRDEPAAEQVLREIVSMDPGQSESWRNLAVLYRHRGRLAEAAAVSRSARVHCTRDPDLRLLQGIVLREMGDLIGAETCLLGVASGEPGCVSPRSL